MKIQKKIYLCTCVVTYSFNITIKGTTKHQTSKEKISAHSSRSCQHEHLRDMQLPNISSTAQSSNAANQIPSSISSHLGFGANSGPISIINVDASSDCNVASSGKVEDYSEI